jgi:outer membrane protein OmpA-like peptidoglycan-associated protein
MRHSRIPSMPAATAILGLFFGLIFAPPARGQTQGSWTVKIRAMQNPLPLGQCTAIEVTVTDATGGAPVKPDRRQVDWQDFDLSLIAPTADAFAWSDPTRPRFLCARAPTATSALVVASYPAKHLTAAEVVPGITAQQAVEVTLQGAVQPTSSASAPGQPYLAAAPQAQNYGQTSNPAAAGAAGAGPSAAGAAGAAPQAENYGQTSNPAAAGAGAGAGQPGGGAAGAAPQGQSYPASPNQAGAAAGQYAAQPIQQASPTSGGAAPTTVAATAGAPVQLTTPPAEKGGGFFKKLGQHLKDKASEVTSQTATNLTNSATQVVDVTAQTGSNLVSGAAAQVTSVAQTKVGGVTSSLVPSALRGGASADNLAMAVQSGRAELRMMRFIGNTDVLDATGRDLIRRLAVVLKTTPGNFVIQAHVDLLPSPADPGASQVLSEHRAAAVKTALIAAGVEATRLTALGYGTSDPKPEAPVEGGPPSSARVVIAKLQQ